MQFPPLDIEKVNKLINEIKESVERLKEFQKLSLEEFESGKDNYAIVEHHLRRSLEGIISLATHILSRIPGGGKAKDYTESILFLGKFGVIPRNFAEKIKGMASYRNRLVHLYWDISHKEIYQKVKNELEDFEKFCEYILKYIKSTKSSQK